MSKLGDLYADEPEVGVATTGMMKKPHAMTFSAPNLLQIQNGNEKS